MFRLKIFYTQEHGLLGLWILILIQIKQKHMDLVKFSILQSTPATFSHVNQHNYYH